MLSSFFIFSGGVTLFENTSALPIEPEKKEMISRGPSSDPAPRRVPMSMLVYTKYVDNTSGGEWENTMTAINNTYGTNYFLSFHFLIISHIKLYIFIQLKSRKKLLKCYSTLSLQY